MSKLKKLNKLNRSKTLNVALSVGLVAANLVSVVPAFAVGSANSAMTSTSTKTTLSSSTASFDKNAPKDVTVVMMPVNGYTLNAIKYGTKTLNNGTDYTLDNATNTVTIKKEYLLAQSTGTKSLKFDFNSGTDPYLRISVKDSRPVVKLSTTSFDAKHPRDVTATMTLKGYTFSGIEGLASSDYSVSGSRVTIKKAYLATLGNGTKSLQFNYVGVSPVTANITIKNSGVVATALSSVSVVTDKVNDTITAKFDKAVTDTTGLVLKQTVDGTVNAPSSAFTLASDGLSATAKVASVVATTADQTVVYSVSYKGVTKTAQVTVAKIENLAISSVNSITKTQIVVGLSKAVDSAVAANFVIPGVNITAAALDTTTKKTVTLTVSGTQAAKAYVLTATGLKSDTVVQPDATFNFTMPTSAQLFSKTDLTAPVTELKADGGTSTLVTFSLKDSLGNVVTSAQNVEVAFSTTFGSFAEKRVAVQNGVATVMLTSEFLSSDKVAYLNATVVEADDQDLIGIVATNTMLMTPNPGVVDPSVGASMTAAEADQADRVIAYFNKDVSPSMYVDSVTGLITHATVAVKKEVLDDGTGGTAIAVKGLLPVAGNSKALQIVLDRADAAFPLTDNANVSVSFTDNTGTIPVPVTKIFKLTDARIPAMLSVVNDGLRTLKVTFSEPINDTAAAAAAYSAINTANWSIDGQLLTGYGITVGDFDPIAGTDARNVVTITLPAGKYLTGGVHSIQAAGIGDWARVTDTHNVMNTQTLDFTIPNDNTVPGATVTVQSPEQWLITFDKDITQTEAQLAAAIKLQKLNATPAWVNDTDVNSYVTIANDAPLNADANLDIAVTQIDASHVLIETDKDWTQVYDTQNSHKNYFNDQYRLFIPANTITAATNGKKNVDIPLVLGGVMTVPDVTSPVISSMVKITDNSYNVTMSEPVKMGTANAEGVTLAQGQTALPVVTADFIKSDNSVTIQGTVNTAAFVDTADQVINVAPLTALTTGDWKLVVRSISDDVGNTAPSATYNFNVAGPTPSDTQFKVLWSFADVDTDKVVENVPASDADTNADYVFVKFSKPVALTGDYANALKTANYLFDGQPLPLGTQILANIAGYDDADSVVDSVTIKLPNGYLGAINAPHVLNVSSTIKSSTGDVLLNPGEELLPYNAPTSAYLTAAEALDADIIAADTLLAANSTIVVPPTVGVDQAEYDLYAAAIATAKTVLDDPTQTDVQITAAQGVLTAATTQFNADILD